MFVMPASKSHVSHAKAASGQSYPTILGAQFFDARRAIRPQFELREHMMETTIPTVDLHALIKQTVHLTLREANPEEAARRDRQRTEGAQTLLEFFEGTYRPDRLQFASAHTIATYRAALGRWESETKQPAISTITDGMLRDHVQSLAKDLKPATVNRNLRHIRCVLCFAGPRGIGYPDGKDIIAHVPFAKSVPDYRELPRCIEPDLIGRLYDACKVAKKPNGWAVQYWRALFVLVVQTGVRINAAQNISIKDIDWKNRILALRACHAKTRTGQLHPLTEVTLGHLDALCRRRGFLKFLTSRTEFYREWKRIRTAAGVDSKHKIAFHDVRRTVATEITKTSGVEAAKLALGHLQLSTTLRSYINFEKLIEPMNRRPMHFTPAEPAPEPISPAEVLRRALAKGRLVPGEIKEAMLLCGIQQKEIANEFKVSKAIVSMALSGEASMTDHTEAILREALGSRLKRSQENLIIDV